MATERSSQWLPLSNPNEKWTLKKEESKRRAAKKVTVVIDCTKATIAGFLTALVLVRSQQSDWKNKFNNILTNLHLFSCIFLKIFPDNYGSQ